MEKIVLKIAAWMLLCGTAGCFSLETADLGEAVVPGMRVHAGAGGPVSHIVVANDGWYLFHALPLATGNASDKASFPFRFFTDDVKEDILQGRLTKYAAATDCDVADLALLSDDQVLLSIPGLNIPLPLPYIITYRRMQISAVLTKHADVRAAEKESARRRAMSREMNLLLNEIPNGDGSKGNMK